MANFSQNAKGELKCGYSGGMLFNSSGEQVISVFTTTFHSSYTSFASLCFENYRKFKLTPGGWMWLSTSFVRKKYKNCLECSCVQGSVFPPSRQEVMGGWRRGIIHSFSILIYSIYLLYIVSFSKFTFLATTSGNFHGPC